MNRGSNPALALNRTERRRRDASARVLEVATGLFAERGFGETSMAAIAAAADVSVGTLYNLFQSKEALYQELIHGKALGFNARLSRAIDSGTTPAEALDLLIEEMFATYKEEAVFLRLYFELSPHARVSLRGSLPDKTRALFDRTMRHLAATIESMAGVDTAEPTPAAQRLATCCHRMANELFLLHLDDPDLHPEAAVLEEAKRFVRMVTTEFAREHAVTKSKHSEMK